jgi:DNA-binding transcriptional MerR regulator
MQLLGLGFVMDASVPDKAYFRIGEVSKILGVEPYVVRYWESEFRTVKPIRTSSDQRLYRRKDVQTLLVIKELLYVDYFTIAGAKRKLAKLSVEKNGENSAVYKNRLVEIKNLLQQMREILQ